MDARLLYISLITTFVFIIPFISLVLYRQFKKYGLMKNDVLMGINISKVLINLTENLLLEYGFCQDKDKDKVKLLSRVVLKTIDYLIMNKSDCTDEVKVKEGLKIAKDILWEYDVVLSLDEENMISDVIRIGINAVNGK